MDQPGRGRHDAVTRIGPPGRVVTAWCLVLALGAWACGGGEGDAGRPPRDTAETAAGTGTGGPAGEGEEQARELTEVDRFLSYSAADSMVDLKLWAGYGGANSAWNFDGYHHGNATVVVPAGWRVEVTYQTLDANVPHSAAVVEPVDPIPPDGSSLETAFAGATTSSFVTGIPSTADPVEFDFRADRPGRYWIMCGVPGHAVGGMWIWLEVSDSATAPAFRSEEG